MTSKTDCKCDLCGCSQVETQETQGGYTCGCSPRKVTVDKVQRRQRSGLMLCGACNNGLESGKYAAVGVAHELKGIKLGHAYDVPKGIKALLSPKLPGPTFSVSSPMSLERCLERHAKGAAEHAADKQEAAELAQQAAEWQAEHNRELAERLPQVKALLGADFNKLHLDHAAGLFSKAELVATKAKLELWRGRASDSRQDMLDSIKSHLRELWVLDQACKVLAGCPGCSALGMAKHLDLPEADGAKWLEAARLVSQAGAAA